MKLMIIDGNSIVNRAFYGVRQLSAPDGTPTNAIYGFLAIFQRIYEQQQPNAACVAFDLKAPTFRHKAYDGYKAQRKPMPEELAVQMPILKQVLDAMGIRRFELEGFEADDILGTAAAKCEASGWDCVVVTGDRDSLQLISGSTAVCNVKTRMGQTETLLYTPDSFQEEYGFEPKRMVDLKALMGDASDNIPGVLGIGEKTAMDLIRRYTSIDAIYAALPELDIKEGVRSKLAAGEGSARQSFWLATIVRDAPVSFEPDSCVWNRDYTGELFDVFKRLGFNKFIEKWGLSETGEAAQTAAESAMPIINVVTADDCAKLISALNAGQALAVVSLDGLDKLQLCDGKEVYELSWSGFEGNYNALLKHIFRSEGRKLAHGLKDLIRLLQAEGLSADGFVFDTALAAYLLDSTENDYSLSRLTARYLGRELSGAQAVYELYKPLEDKLSELGMLELYNTAELPLCRVLAEMEQTGFLVDRRALSEFGESLNAGIDELQRSVWQLAGREFNINSPKQLGEVLFDELMLPSGKKTKTGWSTNADVLEKLQGKHPIIGQVLEYRMLTKLKSTYADGLMKVIEPDGRIHTSFQMTVTATGRLSSTEPNLQNIPVRKKLGAQIRRMFVAAPGRVLVDADYSQIELRLLAHIAGDKDMQSAFLSGEDFHAVTAANVFNVPLDEVTPELRSRAKAVNFGIVYGISAFSLAQDIGVYPNEAKSYIEAYLEKYHGVREYMKAVVEKAKEDGYVATLYGRRRYLPELKSSNFNMRSFGERVALNMPVQGTAADIMKIAMVNVHRRIEAEGLSSRLILQVHDELIAECPLNESERVRQILEQEMRGAASLAVPLIAEAKQGKSWAEAH